MAARPLKAPGIDGLPTLVWQKLWPEIQDEIFVLFQQSIQSGKLPGQWKKEKVLPMRKPNKGDYTTTRSYRPISLLSNLGKILEGVIAERISYLVETHGLLPNNHFGARKGRSTVQALTILQERIYRAWKEKKVLSLINFDIKGAFNGVSHSRLIDRLRNRGLPEVLVKWVSSFCADRSAAILVNGVLSEVRNLPQAGIPQGSPLSPVLFLFFNAELVETKINANGGAIAFADDYSAWVTGISTEQTTASLQNSIIPKALRWAAASGVTFDATKTSLIHFSRQTKFKGAVTSVTVQNTVNESKNVCKVLGVYLDRELRFKDHAREIAVKGVKAALALKRLKGLQTHTARQLYKATIAPIIDYASPIWSPTASNLVLKALEPVQRLSASAITGSFRTVSLPVAEAEAFILPTKTRHLIQRAKNWINFHSTPRQHPVRRLQKGLDLRCKRYKTPLEITATEFQDLSLKDLEIISPFSVSPWQARPAVEIEESDKIAVQKAQTPTPHGCRDFFVDGSARNNQVSVGIYSKSLALEEFKHARVIGSQSDLTAQYAELAALEEALDSITFLSRQIEYQEIDKVRIYSDCKSALQALQNPKRQSGQSVLKRILGKLESIQTARRLQIQFLWVPAHSKVEGNEKANSLAKSATAAKESTVPLVSQVCIASCALGKVKELSSKHWADSYATAKGGKHTRNLDKALPSAHTKSLYDYLPRNKASILAQLRTGKCRLKSYLHAIGAEESELCECGGIETVKHVLLDCRLRQAERKELRGEDRWGDMPYLLGGWSGRKDPRGRLIDGEAATWKPNMKVVRATIDFAIKTGRFSDG